MSELFLGLLFLVLSEILPGNPSPQKIEKELQPYLQGFNIAHASPEPPVLGVTSEVTVARVVDGDTIILSTGETVRYIGIDTPETKDPRKDVQCFGQEAAQKNKELVAGKTVVLEKDISETDRYGRLLRYVYVEGKLVNKTLVEEGYARASSYPPDVKYQEEFTFSEKQAQEQRKGLWEKCLM